RSDPLFAPVISAMARNPLWAIENLCPHAPVRLGAALCVGHGLRHRRGHRGTTLVVVLAFGDLTDEAVTRRLRRSASHVDLRAVDEDPRERPRPSRSVDRLPRIRATGR